MIMKHSYKRFFVGIMKYLFYILVAISLSSCIGINTSKLGESVKINSFSDPDFITPKYPSVLINVLSGDFDRKNAEENAIKILFNHTGIYAEAYHNLIFPTRVYSDKEIDSIITFSDFSSVLLVEIVESEYVYTSLSDGTEIKKPKVKIELKLIDVNSQRTAWIGKSYNSGNAYESLPFITLELYKEVAKKLIKDNILYEYKDIDNQLPKIKSPKS